MNRNKSNNDLFNCFEYLSSNKRLWTRLYGIIFLICITLFVFFSFESANHTSNRFAKFIICSPRFWELSDSRHSRRRNTPYEYFMRQDVVAADHWCLHARSQWAHHHVLIYITFHNFFMVKMYVSIFILYYRWMQLVSLINVKIWKVWGKWVGMKVENI